MSVSSVAQSQASARGRRFVDPGAIGAAWVGVGMAVVIGISFLMVIPIEPVYWALAPFAGILIGYYANQRSERFAGPWSRIVANAVVAGLATGLTFALLLLAVKALFFFADNGYRDASLGGTISCRAGADCVYQRYVQQDAPRLVAGGVRDVGAFTAFYWSQQISTAGTLVAVSLLGALLGAGLYGATRPKPSP